MTENRRLAAAKSVDRAWKAEPNNVNCKEGTVWRKFMLLLVGATSSESFLVLCKFRTVFSVVM